MPTLQEALAAKIPAMRSEAKEIVAKYGDKVISEVTVAQAFGGMRGVKCMICDTSTVDADKGLIVRGRPIGELTDKLPEEIFYLLLTGDLPDKNDLATLQDDLRTRREVPDYVWKVLYDLPKDTHPMQMFDTAILVLGRDSVFQKRYGEGMRKTEYWEPVLDDALNLIAKLPAIAAAVYRIRFDKGEPIKTDGTSDWSGDFAKLLGIPDPDGRFADFLRLYLTLHCDHEGGNVSANTCHVVGSALADPYYAVSAGLNGLAGPLHGLASQECLRFVLAIQEKFKGVPSADELKAYVWEVLKSGKVVPGYGHAVLRVTDPRFTALHAFGLRICKEGEAFRIMDLCFQEVPGILKEHGKAKSPYPNVDSGTGPLLHYFGITEHSYYTVLFGVSRGLGMLSQLIINRAMGTPITRPKSVSTAWIKAHVGA